jgi:hypothetical protein
VNVTEAFDSTTCGAALGVDEELRVLFLADGACWGAAGMVRRGQGFTDRETQFLTAVAPAIATATRLAVRLEATGQKKVAIRRSWS